MAIVFCATTRTATATVANKPVLNTNNIVTKFSLTQASTKIGDRPLLTRCLERFIFIFPSLFVACFEAMGGQRFGTVVSASRNLGVVEYWILPTPTDTGLRHSMVAIIIGLRL